jgi:hypothetical protein
VTARAPADAWSGAIARAFATVAARAGDVPVDKVTLELTGGSLTPYERSEIVPAASLAVSDLVVELFSPALEPRRGPR